MLKAELKGANRLRKQLKALSIPEQRRIYLHRKMARSVISASKKRIKQQKDLTGKSFAPRKNKHKKKPSKKSWAGIRRAMKAYGRAMFGEVVFTQGTAGRTARALQDGFNQTVTAKQAAERNKSINYDDPCTKKQARALKKEGYKIRRHKGKGYKRATIGWIVENLSKGQAGLILRLMRDEKAKESWNVHLPARSFLGATPAERTQLMDFIFNDTSQQVRATV